MKIVKKIQYKFSKYISSIDVFIKSLVSPIYKSYFIGKNDGFEYSNLGMTNESEQKLFFFLTNKFYYQKGKIVDLGCWLGSTTMQLSNGLSQNKNIAIKEIYAFDRFIWEDYMQYAGLEETKSLKNGDSFKFIFDSLLSKSKVKIHSFEIDLKNQFAFEHSIEILLIDAMKDLELTNSISENFCKKLIKGGYLIHQDFAHEFTPWIHIHLFTNKNKLKHIYSAPFSGSSLFKVISNNFEQIKVASEYSVNFINEAFNYSLSFDRDISHKDKIRVAHIRYLIEAKYEKEAKLQLLKYFKSGYSEYGPLSSMTYLLKN